MMHETIYMKPAPDTYVFTCIPSGPLFPIQYMYSIGRESRTLLHIADELGAVRPQACRLRLTSALRSLTGAVFVRATPGALQPAEVALCTVSLAAR
jgi:hypothetical protein